VYERSRIVSAAAVACLWWRQALQREVQPQPHEPPQQPPPPPVGPLKLGFELDPWTANEESCLRAFVAPQLGQAMTCSSFRTSSSKCSSHFMHAYS
jgi:hypothetical protein